MSDSKRFIKHFIWYEKYRPKVLGDLVLPKEYREVFEKYIEEKEIPHLLFFGPNGSGKTTLSFILMDALDSSRLVLNASSEDRGIATIKGKVKQFAGSKSIDGRPKIVLLDEADKLSTDAMDALRNTMETYSQSCRFILTGNYIDKISKALKSRCTIYEFSAYSKKRLYKRLQSILEVEKVSSNREDLTDLIERGYPDVRTIINTLQMASASGKLNPKVAIGAGVDPVEILGMIMKGDVGQLRKSLFGVTDFVWIYRFLFDSLLDNEKINDGDKKELVSVLSEYMYRDALVVSREINFIACCVDLMGVFGCKKISF